MTASARALSQQANPMKGNEMFMMFQIPALSPTIRYLAVVLIHLRRFINRSVANMLAACERAAMRAEAARRPDRLFPK